MIVTCRICKIVGERAKGQGHICPACSSAYQKAYRANNAPRLKQFFAANLVKNRKDPKWVAKEQKRGRDYWRNLRHEAIMAYGGYKCACCGESEAKFLSIDHIFNNGAEHRREVRPTAKDNGVGVSILTWLKKHKYPAGFQVLCMNCNFGKQVNKGICPHKANLTHENRANSVEGQTG